MGGVLPIGEVFDRQIRPGIDLLARVGLLEPLPFFPEPGHAIFEHPALGFLD